MWKRYGYIWNHSNYIHTLSTLVVSSLIFMIDVRPNCFLYCIFPSECYYIYTRNKMCTHCPTGEGGGTGSTTDKDKDKDKDKETILGEPGCVGGGEEHVSLLVHVEAVGHPEINAVPLMDYDTTADAAVSLTAPAHTHIHTYKNLIRITLPSISYESKSKYYAFD
jgi:hypothetical protein